MGLIADIQRASINDGNGIRTTVFFKGCPLKCEWCHNPECISFEPQEMLYPEKCIGCGRCGEGCYSGARVICGKEMTSNRLMEEILQDKDYYDNGGGVTFSGGEPLAQKEFLNETIDKCRGYGISCAVETSLIYYDDEILSKLDFVMADLKIWNSETHLRYTGVKNDEIIRNFKLLDRLGIPIIVRTPVIPEIDQNIDEISCFARGLKNAVKYELIPYHSLGNAKRKALRLPEVNFEVPGKKYMEELKKYVFLR